MYVGSCVTDGIEWMGDHAISVALVELVNDQGKYFKAINDSYENIGSFDWSAFNAQGFAIARQLKADLGVDIEVRYVQAGEDPTKVFGEGFEVLNDGTVLPKKSLWWCPLQHTNKCNDQIIKRVRANRFASNQIDANGVKCEQAKQ